VANTTQFWLKFNNGAETLWLPVNPESISVSSTHGYEDIEVSNVGEYTILGNSRLKEIVISSFFPRDCHGSYCNYSDLPDPWETAAQVEGWQRSGRPIRFIMTGTDVNLAVTIRSFEYEERGGEPGDVYFTLSMKEHVFIAAAKKSSPASVSGSATVVMPKLLSSAQRPATVNKIASYTVKSGDSLFKIAAKAEVYGRGDDWRKIYNANKTAIGANPNTLKLGAKLVIP
jgi:nucleoid-associated protein YgaU